MNILRIIFDPAILIIITAFLAILIYTVKKYNFVNKNLLTVLNNLKTFNKNDLAFRFKELDEKMSNLPYSAVTWAEFKNTLVFSEGIALKNENRDITFENISAQINNIQTTVDPIYFFNDETLVNSKFNYKFVQIAPTLLTGLGPLFTFLNIAIAFSKIDFSTQENVMTSIQSLMGSMQIAALCSVLAVSFSLVYLIFEKIAYNNKCKEPLEKVQEVLFKLFDNISSEKFLIELLKETKLQNNSMSNLLSAIPAQFKDAQDKSLKATLVPYLENVIFALNKLNENAHKTSAKKTDIVDELF